MRIALALFAALIAMPASAAQYGAAITLARPESLASAIAKLDGQDAAEVLVEAKVTKVCEMKGCWLRLQSAEDELHVTFVNDSFFVPASLAGKTVHVQGRLMKTNASYTFIASGIEVRM